MKTPVLLSKAILLVALLVSHASALSVPERLVYDVNWSGIKAGSAVQEVTAQGDELHIVNTMRSSGLMASFFQVDDKTESVITSEEPGRGRPKFFRENINQGKHKALREAVFNFTALKADGRDLLKKTNKSTPISARTYDSLSSIYAIRSRELEPGQSIFFDVYSFKRILNAEVRVVKREEIRTELGKFKTLMVTSRLKFNGVPVRVGDATFWFTDDSRRIPVKIKTKLKVGEVTLTLVGGSHRP